MATLAARGATYQELFAALHAEAGHLLAVHNVALIAFEPDGPRLVANWSGAATTTASDERLPLDSDSFVMTVARTGRPARTEDPRDVRMLTGDQSRDGVQRAGISMPVMVDGRVWGALTATTAADPQAQAEAEHCLRPFADLLEASIENEQTRAGLARLAEEQQALRELATLVARGARPDELFTAATAAAGRVVRADIAVLGHFEADGTVSYRASWSETGNPVPVDARLQLDGDSLTSIVARTGRPARRDSYADVTGDLAVRARAAGASSGVAVPITVGGLAWGLMATLSTGATPLPPETESRLAAFTELLGTAIANADSSAARARLAREQTAMRRLATLVVAEAAEEELFAAVTEETGLLLEADVTALVQVAADDTMAVVAAWSRIGKRAPAGSWRLTGEDVASIAARTGSAVRIANHVAPLGEIVDAAAKGDAVATPVVVRGRVWGALAVFSGKERALTPDADASLADLSEMMARALANAEARTEVAASRARIVAAADDARRRIERNLHDGAQQRLVSLGLELRATQAGVPPQLSETNAALARLAQGLIDVQDELREIARGIHPAILAEGGLGPALKTLARRSAIPVELDLQPHSRLPEQVEVAAYYVVSEALTNAARHAQPSRVRLEVEVSDDVLRLHVVDDGVGGADPTGGSGLVGLTDRVEALGGTITIQSPAGAGTSLRVELPLAMDW